MEEMEREPQLSWRQTTRLADNSRRHPCSNLQCVVHERSNQCLEKYRSTGVAASNLDRQRTHQVLNDRIAMIGLPQPRKLTSRNCFRAQVLTDGGRDKAG